LARIHSAILCDFAQVREGLLFISSGGITRAFREDVPAPLGMALAIVVEIACDELELAHEINVSIKHPESAQVIAGAVGGLQVNEAATNPGENLYVPFVAALQGVVVPAFGAYDVHTAADGKPGPDITFYVAKRPQ
jgi:hypothetical protein